RAAGLGRHDPRVPDVSGDPAGAGGRCFDCRLSAPAPSLERREGRMNVMSADVRASNEAEFYFAEPANLSEELRMLREQVRRFVEKEVVPHGEQWERDGKIPREIFRRMGALGFLGMRHEAEYGGTGMGPLASMVFAEELGRCSFGGFTSSTLVHSD